ncbi:MAG: hypothetical protein LBP85_09275 [Prevotellaceae bacterium]|jgi:hypothetical protein|nr:hypothetical protein [Prevotellaceae bacterium]
MNKGPQTIEKAKQGAYVARMTSSLQKIRTGTGESYGIIYKNDNSYIIKPFTALMQDVICSCDKDLLQGFILTIGIVSNHGNWFTSENPNKELKVLSQSYDWLLFLTDNGLSEFIDSLLLNPSKKYVLIKETFLSSYKEGKRKNQFTKVQMNLDADKMLLEYFNTNIKIIERWFNIITPKTRNLLDLKKDLDKLKTKNWIDILNFKK